MAATIRVIGQIAAFNATPKTVTSPVKMGRSAILIANTASRAPIAVVTATKTPARTLKAVVSAGCSCKKPPIFSTIPANAEETPSTAGVTTDENAVLILLDAFCHFSSRVVAASAVWLSVPSALLTALIQS